MDQWMWLGVVWLVLCVLLAIGLGRWFRYMRDQDEDEEHRW